MIKDQINVNTYLNLVIAIILSFFGYIGLQYEKRFDSIDSRFISLENSLREEIKENGKKIDHLISIVNENRVNIARIEEKFISIEDRVSNLEVAINIKNPNSKKLKNN